MMVSRHRSRRGVTVRTGSLACVLIFCDVVHGGCLTGSPMYQNTAILSQSGHFTVEFDATPGNANMDGITALSLGAGSNHADYATDVRFDPDGSIVVRNGNMLGFDVEVLYTVGLSHHFRLQIDVPNHIHSVWVTPPSGSEIKIATDYQFRDSQNTVESLDNWAIRSSEGTHEVCNFSIAPIGLPTTPADFLQAGTQPGGLVADMVSASGNCLFCHAQYDPVVEPYRPWAASMMGQSARDPMFWACLAVANQDADGAGEFCLRCHVPNAFLGDRVLPADGSALIDQDFEGVNCNFCHRLVNPQFPVPGDGPPPDEDILADLDLLGLVPPQNSHAQYVVDPNDSRRRPFEILEGNPHNPVPIYVSPFHTQSEMCWTCHDVSNMLFMRQPDETYVMESLGTPHSTGSQSDMFPLHRTYSEWQNSYYFTLGGVQHNGRFGGNHPTGVMNVCQDCHMPDQIGKGCGLPAFPERPDVPQHSFIGSNTWGLKAVRAVDADGDTFPDFPDSETGLTQATVDAMIARNIDMLENASDVVLTQLGDQLQVRVVNQTGHKLPTGFPDGRRMWINVKFLDSEGQVAIELGKFDFSTGAIINPQETTVYEILLGLDAAQAAVTGLPEGETFHFMLANMIAKDNRIPPRGFSNTVAVPTQTMVVGATYADGQHWDDVLFDVPGCATQAVVTVYYQLVSDEYITFLRDANVTNNRGDVAFDLWADAAVGDHGAPVVMDMATLVLTDPVDLDGDGMVGITDMLQLLAAWGGCPPAGTCLGDLDCDGLVGITDFLILLASWEG